MIQVMEFICDQLLGSYTIIKINNIISPSKSPLIDMACQINENENQH